jgi:hypothetical protein
MNKRNCYFYFEILEKFYWKNKKNGKNIKVKDIFIKLQKFLKKIEKYIKFFLLIIS